MTITIHLVRHGQAAAGWDQDIDPGLDEVGRAQAQAVADTLGSYGPLRLVVSPLRRTQETAAPLAERWGVEPELDSRIAEIPSPVPDLAARGIWLRDVLSSHWWDVDDDLQRWRDNLLYTIGATPTDTVFVTHFVAVNVVLGAVQRDARVVVAPVANGSITTFERDGDDVRLVDLGETGQTQVL